MTGLVLTGILCGKREETLQKNYLTNSISKGKMEIFLDTGRIDHMGTFSDEYERCRIRKVFLMETIEINGRKWDKFKGDEGQDVYVAHFLENEEDVLGKYVDDTSYDILVESDADFYMPATMTGSQELTEDRIAFKFRKNVFTDEEQRVH
jgi:hypothetical protein